MRCTIYKSKFNGKENSLKFIYFFFNIIQICFIKLMSGVYYINYYIFILSYLLI